MEHLVEQLSAFSSANAGKPVDTAAVVLYQKNLSADGFPLIPAEYVKFLHHFNAFAWNGSFLYGITPLKDFFLDIWQENILADHPFPEQNLILGCNEYDNLLWNCADKCFQIIDKSNFMVLNTYADCADALRHILKIENDIQYL